MIDLEEILAAVIQQVGGKMIVDGKTMEMDYSGYVIAIDYDAMRDELIIQLVDKEDVEFEDEENEDE